MPSNNKIAKNTAFLYIRMAVIMVVTLFTSRVILASLGVEDYGIYNVIAGIVTTFNVLLGMLVDASQRFFSFELGRGREGNVSEVFSISIMLHFILSIIVILISETLGYWFLNHVLVIPPERMFASNVVFQFSILSFVAVIMGTPFDAMIIANEKMNIYAYISIADAVLRLSIAYIISVTDGDKLIMYALLLSLLQICCSFLYFIICRISFKECHFYFSRNKKRIKEIGSFAGWTIMGNFSFMCSSQGVNLLLGSFFSPVVSAARGVSVQVQSAFRAFVVNFQLAVNPQITKSYASGDKERFFSLIHKSSRISFFLVFIPLIPVVAETDLILKLWLKTVPDDTVIFVRVMLLSQILISLRNPLEIAIKASGSIKNYELLIGLIGISIIPVGYVCFILGMPPVTIFIILVFVELLTMFMSLIEARKRVFFSISLYFQQCLTPVILTVVASAVVPILINCILSPGYIRLVLQLIVSPLVAIFVTYYIGLKSEERDAVKTFIKLRKRLCQLP